MSHPTDPIQLRRWLVAPRTGATPAEQAYAIERFKKQGVSAAARVIYGALGVVAGLLLFVHFYLGA